MGGAVFNYNGAVTIDDSTISGNTADQGGAIYGVVAKGADTLTINNTILTGSTTAAHVATTDFVENDLVELPVEQREFHAPRQFEPDLQPGHRQPRTNHEQPRRHGYRAGRTWSLDAHLRWSDGHHAPGRRQCCDWHGRRRGRAWLVNRKFQSEHSGCPPVRPARRQSDGWRFRLPRDLQHGWEPACRYWGLPGAARAWHLGGGHAQRAAATEGQELAAQTQVFAFTGPASTPLSSLVASVATGLLTASGQQIQIWSDDGSGDVTIAEPTSGNFVVYLNNYTYDYMPTGQFVVTVNDLNPSVIHGSGTPNVTRPGVEHQCCHASLNLSGALIGPVAIADLHRTPAIRRIRTPLRTISILPPSLGVMAHRLRPAALRTTRSITFGTLMGVIPTLRRTFSLLWSQSPRRQTTVPARPMSLTARSRRRA